MPTPCAHPVPTSPVPMPKELTRWEQPAAGQAREAEIRSQYGSVTDLEALISEKNAYLNRLKYAQKGIELASVSDNEDFNTYKGYVSTMPDDFWGRLGARYSAQDNDKLLYEYINGAENGMRNKIMNEKSIFSAINSYGDVGDWKAYDYRLTQGTVLCVNLNAHGTVPCAPVTIIILSQEQVLRFVPVFLMKST